MKRLLLVTALALLVALVSAFLQPPDERVDAGVFHAFWATLAIIAALAVNSVIARQRGAGRTGPFGPGLPTVAQTFWTTMAISIAIGCVLLQVDSGVSGPDNYAMGAGAIIPTVLALLALLVCLLFLLIGWWPWRLTLATASGCTAAFACMAITWWR